MRPFARYVQDRDVLLVTSAFVKIKLTANVIVKIANVS